MEAASRLLELLLHHAHIDEMARHGPSPENVVRKDSSLGIVLSYGLRRRLRWVGHPVRHRWEWHLTVILLLNALNLLLKERILIVTGWEELSHARRLIELLRLSWLIYDLYGDLLPTCLVLLHASLFIFCFLLGPM